MDDIRNVLQRAARRLFLIDLLGTIVFSAFVVLCVLAAMRVAQKLFPTFEIDWMLATRARRHAAQAGRVLRGQDLHPGHRARHQAHR